MIDHALDILNKGAFTWNSWRDEQLNQLADLSKIVLSQTQPAFRTVKEEFIPREFENFNFTNTDFSESLIKGAKFTNCIFTNSNFYRADLRRASFKDCDLINCRFHVTNLTLTTFINCNFRDSLFWETTIARTSFSNNKNLHLVKHGGPSIIDHRTFQKSTDLPIELLRGIGLTEELIKFHQSKFSNSNFCSCFISHSTKDQEFALKLYTKLQNKGIRCWYAPKDLNYGDKIRDEIESAITEYEKLLIVLSSNSIESYWVEDEVEAAIEKERETQKGKLLPISLEKDILNLDKSWFNKIKRTRHIGDFSDWKEEEKFTVALEKLVLALKK